MNLNIKKLKVIITALCIIGVDISCLVLTAPKVVNTDIPVVDSGNSVEEDTSIPASGVAGEGDDSWLNFTVIESEPNLMNENEYSNTDAKITYEVSDDFTVDYVNTEIQFSSSIVETPVEHQQVMNKLSTSNGSIEIGVFPFIYDDSKMSSLNVDGITSLDEGIIDYIVTQDTTYINDALNDIDVSEINMNDVTALRIAFVYNEEYHVDYCIPYVQNIIYIRGVKATADSDIDTDIRYIASTLEVGM